METPGGCNILTLSEDLSSTKFMLENRTIQKNRIKKIKFIVLCWAIFLAVLCSKLSKPERLIILRLDQVMSVWQKSVKADLLLENYICLSPDLWQLSHVYIFLKPCVEITCFHHFSWLTISLALPRFPTASILQIFNCCFWFLCRSLCLALTYVHTYIHSALDEDINTSTISRISTFTFNSHEFHRHWGTVLGIKNTMNKNGKCLCNLNLSWH